jgi:hypothetical protein
MDVLAVVEFVLLVLENIVAHSWDNRVVAFFLFFVLVCGKIIADGWSCFACAVDDSELLYSSRELSSLSMFV